MLNKLCLVVTHVKHSGIYTTKANIDLKVKLHTELTFVLKYIESLYKYLGNIDEILLVSNSNVFARFAGGKWYDKDDNEVKEESNV